MVMYFVCFVRRLFISNVEYLFNAKRLLSVLSVIVCHDWMDSL